MIHSHHRKARSQGGGDEPTNILRIPDPLHDWIHANPEKAYELGLLVRSTEDPAEIVVTIPEEFVRVRKPTVQDVDQPAKKRGTVGIKVPKKDPSGEPFQEDGAVVLDALFQAARERLVEEMGWKDDVPNYFVVTAVFHDWLTS